VSVLVVSERTRQPIKGIEVATLYVPKPFSLASRRQDKQPTGADGIAVLRANYLKREPTLLGLSEGDFAPMFCVSHDGATTLIMAACEDEPQRSGTNLRKHPVVTFQLSPRSKKRGEGPVPSPSEVCAQRSAGAQLWTDLGAVWLSLSKPFRREVACGGPLEK
jgi:hypothetical protein